MLCCMHCCMQFVVLIVARNFHSHVIHLQLRMRAPVKLLKPQVREHVFYDVPPMFDSSPMIFELVWMQTPRLEGGLRAQIYESIGYLNAMYKYLSIAVHLTCHWHTNANLSDIYASTSNGHLTFVCTQMRPSYFGTTPRAEIRRYCESCQFTIERILSGA